MSTAETTRQLGRYELLKRIAKGGMGEIYLARTRGAAGFEKNCIIKTILPHLAEEEEFVTKFLDEGRIVVQLVHGNIVPVFDMGDENGEIFIAMEYIPGRDLREVTKQLAVGTEPMPVDLALFITSEVCKGLDYAHRKTSESGTSLGLVHRDVSPSNVLISREGEVKLIDFGIARAAGKLGKTVSGRIQGKFCYMSPEQASGKRLDGRSDIFSAGIVLYELLTGFRPFEGDTDLASLDLVRRCEFDPPSTLNGEVTDEIDGIVARALQKDPNDRYQTIDKLQIAILQYLYSTGTSPTSNDLEAFLGELFPDGLERAELRAARDSGAPPKAMSLDEALDFEFDRLGGLDSDVDPHETTAISSAELTGEPRTQTGSERGDSPPLEIVVPPETPATSEAVRATTGRPWLMPLVLLMLVAGGGAVFTLTGSTKGRRTISSAPPGAQISVDGLLIPGALTPYSLKLDEGSHTIELDLEGHEKLALMVEVEARSEKELAVTKLKRKTAPRHSKTFRLHATPDDAEFFLDDNKLGSPTLTLSPGQVARVVAKYPGCESRMKTVDYEASNGGITFDLDCSDDTPDAGATAPTIPEPTTKRLSIRSSPPGAEIVVNGKSLGTAPVNWSGPSDTILEITATKEGLKPVTMKRAASKLRRNSLMLTLQGGAPGCLHFSIINPMIAEWAIDGRSVGKKKGLRNHRLPAGKHKIRVSNQSVGLDFTQSFDIKPGEKCSELFLDGNKLPK